MNESTKEVSFYFDFSSPFAYLANTQIESVAARHGAKVRYRPFLLGGLFKSIGTVDVPLFQMPDSKRRYYSMDIFRWADHYGVPFRFPGRFPMNTVKPLRMVLALQEDEERRKLIGPIFHAYWAEDQDISNESVLRQIATKEGFDADKLIAATQDTEIKAKLREATETLEKLGGCGAPTFLVGKLLFWGQDRLMFVEKALDGWIPNKEQD